MSRRYSRRDRMTDEAALWFVRAQDPGFTAADREELASWLTGSAEHVREYLSLAAIARDIRELTIPPSVDELIALARSASDEQNVIAMLDRTNERIDVPAADSAARPRGRRRTAVWAAATSVLIAVIAGFWVYTASDPTVYSTGVGEQVSFPLDDGSVVTLNAQSSLELAYSDDHRNVRLVQGEVMFDVAKDPARPFQVLTERAVIQAIGTQFNVRYRGSDTTVTVVEGIVSVRSLNDALDSSGTVADFPGPDNAASDSPSGDTVRLTVGQQAKVASGEVAVKDTNVDKATSWRERRLVFESWALSEVVAEFNLYNDQRIVIEDASLADRPISGAFSADDRASFALFLSEAGLAVPETRPDGTIVLRAAGPRE